MSEYGFASPGDVLTQLTLSQILRLTSAIAERKSRELYRRITCFALASRAALRATDGGFMEFMGNVESLSNSVVGKSGSDGVMKLREFPEEDFFTQEVPKSPIEVATPEEVR